MNPRIVTLLVTGVIIVLAVVLRVPLLSATDLWLDEACTVIDALIPLREIPSLLPHDGLPPQRYVASHPPLYYVIVTAAFGALGAFGWVARAVSVVAIVLLIAVMVRFAPPGVSKRGAYFAGLVVAIHPLSLYYGVEAKMYAMQWLLTACVIAGLAHARGDTKDGRRALAGAALAQAALLYTHNFGLLLAPCWLVALWQQPSTPERVRVFAAGLASVGAWLPWAAITLPWQLRVQSGAENFKTVLLADTGRFERLVDSARALSGVPPFPPWLRTLSWVDGRPFTWLALGLFALAVVGAALAWRTRAHASPSTPDSAAPAAPDGGVVWRSAVLLVCALASTWIGLWLVDLRAPMFLPGRYETPALVPLVWLAALAVSARGAGIAHGRATARVAGAGAVLALVGLTIGALSFVRQPNSHRYRNLVHDVLALGARGPDMIAAGFAWAPMQVAAMDYWPRRDGVPVDVRVFPNALRTSAGEGATLLKDAAGLQREARAIAEATHGALWVVAAPEDRAIAQVLVDGLEAHGCLAPPRPSGAELVRGHEVVRFECP